MHDAHGCVIVAMAVIVVAVVETNIVVLVTVVAVSPGVAKDEIVVKTAWRENIIISSYVWSIVCLYFNRQAHDAGLGREMVRKR